MQLPRIFCMKNSDRKFKAELITPCGMNCGICSAYLRPERKCPGCRPKSKRCSIRNCEIFKKNKFEYCFLCGKFPCQRIERLDNRYRTRYGMSMIENLEFIRKNGIRKFLEKEREIWKCPKCGGVVCVHNLICYGCGDKTYHKK